MSQHVLLKPLSAQSAIPEGGHLDSALVFIKLAQLFTGMGVAGRHANTDIILSNLLFIHTVLNLSSFFNVFN